MLVTVLQYMKVAFLSITKKLTSLFHFNIGNEEDNSLASKSINFLSREFLEQSVWLKKAEGPRLDPSLGGRDPTSKLIPQR